MHLQEFVYRPGLHQPMHVHDYTSLSMIVGGSFEENAARTCWSGGAGHIVVKPRGVMHDDRYGASGARIFTLILDSDEDAGRYRWLFGGSPVALFTRAVAEWRAGSPYTDIAIDLIASAREGALKIGRGIWTEVAERIATSDVSVAVLAAELSMHPVALARAFRREYGCSLTAFRRRARVRRAAELLAQTRVPLADVALESGFTDQSHFCRIFRRETGVTPASFRAAMV
jgi:AraC-like DNA-binding protein